MPPEIRSMRKVLLVTDFRDEREMYAQWLRGQGYCTLQAASASDAFRLAAELAPDVVVTDVRLAGPEDGLGLTRRLKDGEPATRPRVVILTGYAFPRDREDAVRAGCDLFLTKPCLPDALATAVARLVDHV